jgi:hypothetical protein
VEGGNDTGSTLTLSCRYFYTHIRLEFIFVHTGTQLYSFIVVKNNIFINEHSCILKKELTLESYGVGIPLMWLSAWVILVRTVGLGTPAPALGTGTGLLPLSSQSIRAPAVGLFSGFDFTQSRPISMHSFTCHNLSGSSEVYNDAICESSLQFSSICRTY